LHDAADLGGGPQGTNKSSERSARAMEDRIEQQIVIDAPLERVWDLVSRPGWWVPTEVEEAVDRTPGRQTVRESAKWGRFAVEVVRMEPQRYAAFRWASAFPGEDLAPGRTTLVEFSVEPGAEADAGVTVTVVESGFAALDADEVARKSAFEDNTKGWGMELDSLKERAEGAAEA
jgi:uncharacterized protein YndB with AHSA1/START domain